MKKISMGVLAIALAVGAVATSKASFNAHPTTTFTYRFDGVHGQEANESLWTKTNDPISCSSGDEGCRITAQGTVGSDHPTLVEVDQNSKVIVDGTNVTFASYRPAE